MTQAYPLAWPEGWPRTPVYDRRQAKFSTSRQGGGVKRLSVSDAHERIAREVDRLGVNFRDDAIISTNLKLNLSGLPRGDQGEPFDPGVAVYWQPKMGAMKVMAIDIYNRVADNMAAIAASLEAMRAIERHGGAQILERAFSGFSALPAPDSWWELLGVSRDASAEEILAAHRNLTLKHHPDRGGDAALQQQRT